ncbi:MAG: biotin carboxylase N-terminal domain-containing protein [Gammaproteobacteria bacterium]
MTRAFHTILIANRGEIAARVARSARALGYRTVAVYSDADAGAMHVAAADAAVAIGPPPAAQSYLDIGRILDAARRAGADAIHPGYGFLSENAAFARACTEAGIVFIGPPVEAIRLMGSKRLSKLAMMQAGVPCVPGYEGAAQDDATLAAQARRIGFPIMIKASAGGGGRGMRLVSDPSDLAEQLGAARSEARNAFGSDELILERAILEPRHVEIQVFADTHGNCIHLGERDCSIQRRHQKVIEESPSPFVGEDLRARMGAAAVAAARSCGYVGAGTVEFLVDVDRNFHFLEMNTRLQVEHPVTELVTGLDLVEWQIRVAAGEPLPLTQDAVRLSGHAIEARLYAEDPRRGFLPQTGTILRWRFADLPGLRVDAGVAEGQAVSAHYDPMLAKVIAHGPDRATAARRLARALEDACVLGVATNQRFLARALRHPVFLAGQATTGFIAAHLPPDAPQEPAAVALAAVLLHCRGRMPFAGWAGRGADAVAHAIEHEGEVLRVAVLQQAPGRFEVQAGEASASIELVALDAESVTWIQDGIRRNAPYLIDGDALHLGAPLGGGTWVDLTHAPPATQDGAGSGHLTAPMDGAVVEVHRRSGERVGIGDLVLAIEAMKMQTQIRADVEGVIETVHVEVGMQVRSRQVLVVIRALEIR